MNRDLKDELPGLSLGKLKKSIPGIGNSKEKAVGECGVFEKPQECSEFMVVSLFQTRD